jgi:hypothetical protein
MKATGFFRTAKREGKWWLVMPGGNLFLSFGVNSVTTADTSLIALQPSCFRGGAECERCAGWPQTRTWGALSCE